MGTVSAGATYEIKLSFSFNFKADEFILDFVNMFTLRVFKEN